MVAGFAEKADPGEATHSRPSKRRGAARSEPSLEVVLDEARISDLPEVAAIAQLGRYELLGRMAVGGMAEIYLARERSSMGGSRRVAVKVVRSQLEGDVEFETMFLQEGRVALGLKHPNICHVYEVGRSRGRCFIAMEYVHGVTLHDLLRRAAKAGTRVPNAILVKIAAQVAAALHSAHTAKDAASRPLAVVHRDVSPHNVMIGYDGVVKLLDFGVAHARTNVADDDSGTIKGKLGYLAPEQCVGKPMDARADVFALGVCLWEGLTGRRLFKRATELETLTAIVNGDVPDPSEHGADAAPEVTAVLRRALAKSPEERWQSAEELEEALEGYLTETRELVNAARIARFVASMCPGAIDVDPELDVRPEIVSWIGPASIPPPHAAPASKRSRWPITTALVGLGALLGASWWLSAPAGDAAAPRVRDDARAAPASEDVIAAPAAAEVTVGPIDGHDGASDEAAALEPEPAETQDDPSVSAAAPAEGDARQRRRVRREAGERWRNAAPGGFVEDPGF